MTVLLLFHSHSDTLSVVYHNPQGLDVQISLGNYFCYFVCLSERSYNNFSERNIFTERYKINIPKIKLSNTQSVIVFIVNSVPS